MSAISSNPIELFISYAREDKTDKEELIKHLHTLIDEKKISIWHDGEIIPGQEWNEAIIGHLNSSQIILLLISPDFISSDFINKVEKTRAMERYKAREARVIPVILRSADWKTTPIHALEALPEGALPVNEWPNRDKAFLDIVTGIRKVLDSLPPLEASQHSGSAGNMDVDMEEHINDSIYVRPGSKVFPSGHFSNIDTIHVHVDGGTSRELVAAIVDQLDNKRVDSKITYVTRYIAGPQRADLPQVYRSHTPGTSREQLQFFSTTLFSSLSDAKVKLTEILARLSEQEGIVIEVERVVGKVGAETSWSKTPPNEYEEISGEDVLFERAHTDPVEIHHAIDIPKEGPWESSPPLSLKELQGISSKLDIRVGGWFLFAKQKVWAYRSNMFSGPRVSKEDIQQQRDALIKYLNELGGERGFKCDVTVLVEQSLGVWKTSLRRFIAFKTAHELGEWERGFRDLKEFWVVAPNFLGDKDQNVHQAMISNLQRGVKYTYFLSSYADYLRLRSLARSLEQSVRFVNVYDLIKTVLLVTDLDHREDAKKVLEKQYFIANPHRNDREGYELKRSETEEVHVGVRIDDDCIKGIVDKFSLLINRESMVQWVRLPLDFRNKEEEAAVLCTALEANPKQLESLNGRGLNRWEKVIRNYDRIIAEEVSKLGGEVAKGDPNGYLILFDKAKYALLCSEQLQIAMQEFNAGPSLECKLPCQRIALDYGSISRVIRASGVDYFGTPLIRCSILIDKTEFGKIYMTKDIFIKAEEVFTEGYIEQRIHPVSSNIINDSRLPNCFEYIWPLSSWAK